MKKQYTILTFFEQKKFDTHSYKIPSVEIFDMENKESKGYYDNLMETLAISDIIETKTFEQPDIAKDYFAPKSLEIISFFQESQNNKEKEKAITNSKIMQENLKYIKEYQKLEENENSTTQRNYKTIIFFEEVILDNIHFTLPTIKWLNMNDANDIDLYEEIMKKYSITSILDIKDFNTPYESENFYNINMNGCIGAEHMLASAKQYQYVESVKKINNDIKHYILGLIPPKVKTQPIQKKSSKKQSI